MSHVEKAKVATGTGLKVLGTDKKLAVKGLGKFLASVDAIVVVGGQAATVAQKMRLQRRVKDLQARYLKATKDLKSLVDKIGPAQAAADAGLAAAVRDAGRFRSMASKRKGLVGEIKVYR